MLRIEDIAKTFNPGTITEKKGSKGSYPSLGAR